VIFKFSEIQKIQVFSGRHKFCNFCLYEDFQQPVPPMQESGGAGVRMVLVLVLVLVLGAGVRRWKGSEYKKGY